MRDAVRTLFFFLVLLFLSQGTLSFAQTGSIYVTSKPTGANISLDNNPIQQKTDRRIIYDKQRVSPVSKEGWIHYWYSPGAKQLVKREVEKSTFWDTRKDQQNYELISYNLE
jgi:hypothetical protein